MNEDEIIEQKNMRLFLANSHKIQIQLFTLIVTVFGVLYGIAFTGRIASDFILLIPIIIIIIGMRLKFYDYQIKLVSTYYYLKHPYEDASKYTEENTSQIMMIILDVLPKWLLFIFIPMGLAIIYSWVIVFNIKPTIGSIILISIVPIYLHWFFIVLFSIIIILSWLYYFYFKKIRKKHLLQELCDKQKRKRLFGW